jgi:hypothetical protein
MGLPRWLIRRTGQQRGERLSRAPDTASGFRDEARLVRQLGTLHFSARQLGFAGFDRNPTASRIACQRPRPQGARVRTCPNMPLLSLHEPYTNPTPARHGHYSNPAPPPRESYASAASWSDSRPQSGPCVHKTPHMSSFVRARSSNAQARPRTHAHPGVPSIVVPRSPRVRYGRIIFQLSQAARLGRRILTNRCPRRRLAPRREESSWYGATWDISAGTSWLVSPLAWRKNHGNT